MSFRVRLMITFSLLISLTFGIGCTLLISTSFQAALEEKKETMVNEFETLQNNIAMLMQFGDSGDYRNVYKLLYQMEEENIAHWQAVSVCTDQMVIYEDGDRELLSFALPIEQDNTYVYVHVVNGKTSLFTEKQKRRLMKQYTGKTKPEVLSTKYFEELKKADEVTRMQYVDRHLWLPGDILLKADKMSMAHSVELRVPFLDKEVFEVASQIPTNYKVNRNETKIALRMAAKRRIGSTVAGKKKLGFPVPIREWLREEKYAGVVKKSFESQSAKKFFHTRRLVKLLDDHISEKRDNFRQIWCVYMFLVWYEVYFGDCKGEI